MPYIIAHRLDRSWVVGQPGNYSWSESNASSNTATRFQNYFKAKAALETMPIERDSYNFPLQHFFMKVPK